jgi:hypothetical protein
MRVPRCAFAPLAALALAVPAAALERHDVVRRELVLAAGAGRWVEIDNVMGSVEVRAGAGDRVVVEIRRSATARREAELDRAFAEVALVVEESNDGVALAQDGPFRCGERRRDERGRRGRRGWGDCDWDPDYEVDWQWTVSVPADVDLEVSTVNGGSVAVEGVGGAVWAGNVNGPIRLAGLAGEVRASTVNGGIRASFAAPPAAEGRFQTVNGEIELELPAASSAEVELETMNGELWSDFEVRAVARERRGGRDGRTWRLERDTVVRIGDGGPRFECKTLNGDIVLRAR